MIPTPASVPLAPRLTGDGTGSTSRGILSGGRPGHNTIGLRPVRGGMRSEDEIREQYEFLRDQLDDEEMSHRGVEQLFTHYKRALGWVLEEEHM